MAVSLVVNGVGELQSSMADGLDALTLLLSDRGSRGCTITPSHQPTFGVEYRIQHPGNGLELVYLTDYPEATDIDTDA